MGFFQNSTWLMCAPGADLEKGTVWPERGSIQGGFSQATPGDLSCPSCSCPDEQTCDSCSWKWTRPDLTKEYRFKIIGAVNKSGTGRPRPQPSSNANLAAEVEAARAARQKTKDAQRQGAASSGT